MIKMFRFIDGHLGRIDRLPGVFSQWFSNIFIILLSGNFLFAVGFIRLLKKNDKYGRPIFKIGSNLLIFSIFISLISLSVFFMAENMIYLNCLKAHDYENGELIARNLAPMQNT